MYASPLFAKCLIGEKQLYLQAMNTESNTRQRKLRIQANLKEYRFKIEFLVFQEDGTYIAYCPALDISSSGESFNEAVGNFYEMFQLHIECCIENNTLHDDLLAHGG